MVSVTPSVEATRSGVLTVAEQANQDEDCMSWKNRMADIAVGDKVCYRRTFLQSTGQQTGDVPFAWGIVPAIGT
jgi:hypothetical protein